MGYVQAIALLGSAVGGYFASENNIKAAEAAKKAAKFNLQAETQRENFIGSFAPKVILMLGVIIIGAAYVFKKA